MRTPPLLPPAATRLAAAAAAALLVAWPFWGRLFPPITDLGQHVAQIRLFLDAVSGAAPEYEIQWLTPYGLCYGVLGLAWAAVGPRFAGALGAAAIAVLWVLAVHHLAARRGRSVGAALLASCFVFQHALGWGFLSFLFGFPLFVLFWLQEDAARREGSDARRAVRLVVLSFLLYLAHAQWFAFAVGFVGLRGLLDRLPMRQQLRRLMPLLPVGLLAAWWYPSLGRRGFSTPAEYFVAPWDRLQPVELVTASLGLLAGRIETLILVVMLAWIGAGVWQAARRSPSAGGDAGPAGEADRSLLLLGSVFLLMAFLLPDEFQNSIQFARRWMPLAWVFLLLGSPAPRVARRAVLPALALSTLALFALIQRQVWRSFEVIDLAGLEAALESVEPGGPLLGLDFVRQSRLVWGQPFFQMVAYAQARHGTPLNFSFAEFAPSLVVYREQRVVSWTIGLEWLPKLVKERDVLAFDQVLVHGSAGIHAEFLHRFPFTRQVTPGVGAAAATPAEEAAWRLYRVDRAMSPAALPGQ